MSIMTGLGRVESDDYYAIVLTLCQAIAGLEGAPPEIDEILIVNPFAGQGWVFGSPEDCGDIISTPADQQEMKIAVSTRGAMLLSGKDRSTVKVKQSEWYSGGTLSKGTVGDWRSATAANRLATSADFTAVVVQSKGLKLSSMDQLRPLATALETCVSEAAKRPIPDNTPITPLAVGCLMRMDADKGNR